MSESQNVVERSCTCARCKAACERNPGWLSPEDARRAIDAGLSHRLMRDWLEPDSRYGNSKRLYVLAPASLGYEGADAPDLLRMILNNGVKGRCTFLTDGRLCEIHSSGFKPLQCRAGRSCVDDDEYLDNYAMARLWDTPEGRNLVRQWVEVTTT